MTVWLLLTSVLFVGACFEPSLPQIACGPSGECPLLTVCATDGFCRGPGEQGDPNDPPIRPINLPDPIEVIHVPEGGNFPGGDALSLVGGTIDTSTLQVLNSLSRSALTAGNDFEVRVGPGERELAVLHVGSLTIGGTVTVTGTRPLVVISATTISVAPGAILDGAARGAVPGPGGSLPGEGAGAGGTAGVSGDMGGGGGGAGFGIIGAPGGSPGTGGVGRVHGSPLEQLLGGSGGGTGGGTAPCPGVGGGGGGAIQLSAYGQVDVNGAVHVGGGGGTGGSFNCVAGKAAGGGGGGAGGMVILEAPTVTVTGIVAANGGGGGEGGFTDGRSGANGQPGTDGLAGGGTAPGGADADLGGAGGAGAAGGVSVVAGSPGATSEGLAGGGGGGGGSYGHLLIRSRASNLTLGTTSPAHQAQILP